MESFLLLRKGPPAHDHQDMGRYLISPPVSFFFLSFFLSYFLSFFLLLSFFFFLSFFFLASFESLNLLKQYNNTTLTDDFLQARRRMRRPPSRRSWRGPRPTARLCLASTRAELEARLERSPSTFPTTSTKLIK